MDPKQIRKDFPLLESSTCHGRPLVYLDSAATSQKPASVIAAESDFYNRLNANVHRGVYQLSEEATDAYEGARERVGRFLHASTSDEVVFVRGTTEGLNVLATCFGRERLQRGDQVVTTIMEHHSNIVPWHLLRSSRGIELEFLDIDEHGQLRSEDIERKITRRTKVVTLTHASNVLGTVNPIREIAERAHDVGATVIVDAAQSAPHQPIDVVKLGADFVTFSGHKTLGPTGIGVLWGRTDLLRGLPPCEGGGEMIQEVHTDRVTYKEPPARFEAGTPNIAGAYALSRALDYLEAVGWDEIARHEEDLVGYAFSQGRQLFGDRLRFFGPRSPHHRAPVLSFTLDGVHPHDVAQILDAESVAVRSGHHCAQPLMERLGVPALTRASPYIYNGRDDIDAMFRGLQRVEQVFGKPSSGVSS